ncbi:8-oxo-dGTP diphosphatase [Bacillus sp. RG28]|uniref:8-oxo-dGTP diphosphatase n=1 Tax=Gottfriedia endophytica TaxID=2820819 RepID=A0A940NF71_9BACI|nr:8-oxo-dGTP diphosphatase [Gottfriedia endophytica]MBP0724374.1 8-oxo-dGTP diphosphatase [Gottfriedia endophytica]
MIKYTLAFIKRNNELLMLNRIKAPTMGIWNGVGGKIEKDELPIQSIQREIEEETGIKVKLEDIKEKGLVTWKDEKGTIGGMYLFLATIDANLSYNTPLQTEEGILDWKKIEWVLSKENRGVGELIPIFLHKVIHENESFHYSTTYEGNFLKEVQIEKIVNNEMVMIP